MRSTQQFSITLPNKMANAVKAKVSGGEYATESDVIREGLRALMERDHAIEHWLEELVVPAANALQADKSRGLSVREVRKQLDKNRHTRNV